MIVVDDGSTDNSWEVVARFSDRIIRCAKQRRSSLGFMPATRAVTETSSFFWMPMTCCCRRPLNEWRKFFERTRKSPAFNTRLACGGRRGLPSPVSLVPAAYVRMPGGDLREKLLKFNHFTWWPPTSGHAFAAWTLRKILPMPEPMFRTAADYYLVRASTLCGAVVSLDEICGQYRFHGGNDDLRPTIDLDHVRSQIDLIRNSHGLIRQFAESLSLPGCPVEATDVLDLRFIALRIVSLKLDPRRHPHRDEKLFRLCVHGIAASEKCDHLSTATKFLYAGWCGAMALSPRRLARWLAEKFFYPDTRKTFSKLLAHLQSKPVEPMTEVRV